MTCRECGRKLERDALHNKLTCCSSCRTWHKYMTMDNAVRIDGEHYIIGPEGPSAMKGHGGQRFNIIKNDGTALSTTNLWHQGRIPPRFKDRMPDNATFAH